MEDSLPGELLVIGFSGDALSPRLRKYVERWRVGGVILFGRNIRSPGQTAELCRSLQEIRSGVSDRPLFIAVDQEGGAVARFRKGVTVFPGNLALGMGGGEADAFRVGRVIGRELKEIGVNLNLAPVLDLYSLPGNPSTGIRSLGSDPKRVGALGSALVRGMQGQGMVATAKHFPGKGRAAVDSHRELPVITASGKDLNSRDLLPFRAAISAGVKAVMTSHAAYPRLSGRRLPATLCPAIVTGLLRRRLRFDGVVITDDLGMGAVRACCPPEEAAARAVLAGVDIVLFCHGARETESLYAGLGERLHADRRLRGRAEESLERIRRIKSALPFPSGSIGRSSPENDLALKIARRAITVIRDRNRSLPIKKGERIVIAWFHPERTVEVEDMSGPAWGLERYLRAEGIKAARVALPLSPSAEDIGRSLARADSKDRLLIATFDACRFPAQAEAVGALLGKYPAALLVALKDPRDAGLFPSAKTVVAAFGFVPGSLQALAEALTGRFPPRRGPTGLAGID